MGMGSGGFKSGTGNIPDLDVDSGTLSIDADNNRVGIGTTSPEGALHVKTAASHCSITLDPSMILMPQGSHLSTVAT
jgi:hypothetical protein